MSPAPYKCNYAGVVVFKIKNMNKLKFRTIGAELALLATLVEVAWLGSVPEYHDAAIALSIPFMIYGLFFILFLNK